jgi:hypothetical protein
LLKYSFFFLKEYENILFPHI